MCLRQKSTSRATNERTVAMSQFDRQVDHIFSVGVRRLTRREMLTRGLKGVAVSVAGLTVGTLPTWSAFAGIEPDAPCTFPNGNSCDSVGHPCPSVGCPSDCTICRKASGCYHCTWNDGFWATGNCGRCGMGYFLCYDCACSTCAKACGCRSQCQCYDCCSAREVRGEMSHQLALASSR